MDSITDAELWAFALRGRAEGYGRIFDRHRDRILRHSLRLVPSWHDAEEVVAVTFLEAWRKRASVRFVDESILPWLLATATNVARNSSRATRRYRALLDRIPPAVEHSNENDESTASDALRSMSTADQQVITLSVLEGYSDSEIAVVLGIPHGTVKSRLSRAKRRLANHVGASHPHLTERTTS